MIRECKRNEEADLFEVVLNDKFQNVYLYIDLQTYGFKNKNAATYVLIDSQNKPKAIIYKYYNSFQLFEISELCLEEAKQLSEFIIKSGTDMISGNRSLISSVLQILNEEYIKYDGYIMTFNEMTLQKSSLSELAKSEDCKEIAELICTDQNIGGHYTIDSLCEQLTDRMNNWNCKNLVIKEKDKIVSHMATYADLNNISVLGGLITSGEHRGKCYGRTVLLDLAISVIEEGKTPVIYCYDEELVKWYLSLGWKIATECSKLEKRGK